MLDTTPLISMDLHYFLSNAHFMISYTRYLKFQKPLVHCSIQEAHCEHTAKDNDLTWIHKSIETTHSA